MATKRPQRQLTRSAGSLAGTRLPVEASWGRMMGQRSRQVTHNPESGGGMRRTILHVDMDAFYASIEQREHPEYRGKPVIVGADPRGGRGRGVVAACSYEARQFGIRSALPISRAFRLCPRGVYLRPDVEKYQQVSRGIREIFHAFTELVEPISIDEAFLDVSGRAPDEAAALEVARTLKGRILEAHGLKASVGVAPSKLVAKIASDLSKPDGLLLVRAAEVQGFLDPLPIARLWGVGPKTAARLSQRGIRTILQLRHTECAVLVQWLGKLGEQLAALSNGVDERPVARQRAVRSVSGETTFPEDVLAAERLEETVERLSKNVSRRLRRRRLTGRTVTLKLRYSDFKTITRQTTLRDPLQESSGIVEIARRLLRKFRNPQRRVRLIGVSVSGLRETEPAGSASQLKLFR